MISDKLSHLIESQSGHGSIIGRTQTFSAARLKQGELLKSFNMPSVCKIAAFGPGNGEELEVILRTAEIDSNSTLVVGVEAAEARAAEFKKRFPSSNLIQDDILREKEDISEIARSIGGFDLVQIGFLLNDLPEDVVKQILTLSKNTLAPGGKLLIAEILLETCPNRLACLSTPDLEEKVNAELQDYYTFYLSDVAAMPGVNDKDRAQFEESIHKAWKDALEHKDGRESFDTEQSMSLLIENAGFRNVQMYRLVNKCRVITAEA